VQNIRVAAIVGINSVLGEDTRVFYPLVVLWSITLLSHHVPEATVADPCLEDLSNLPPLVPVHLEGGWWLIVLRATGKRVRFCELELHHGKTECSWE
jgi:hypothetical protein